MANPESYPRKAKIKITHGAGSKTWIENSSGIATEFEFDYSENNPAFLMVRLDNSNPDYYLNLLSPGCNVWSSGTGAISEGDKIELGFNRVGLDTVDWFFDGKVASLKQNDDDTLIISAYDPSKAVDNKRISKTIYKNFKDSEEGTIKNSSGYRYVDGFTASDVVKPLNRILTYSDMIERKFGDANGNVQYDLAGDLTRKSAQTFKAEGEYLDRIYIYATSVGYGAGGNGANVNLEIYTDHVDSGDVHHPGDLIKSDVFFVSGTKAAFQYLWVPAGLPKLIKNAKYWIVFSATSNVGTMEICARGFTSGDNIESFKYTNSGISPSWSVQAGSILRLIVRTFVYAELEPTDYFVDEVNDKIYLFKGIGSVIVGDVAIIDYFYGTLTLEEVIIALIKLDTGLLGNVSTDCDRIMNTYATMGKSLGECLRELMDVYENSGTWSGRQHVMAFYRDGNGIPNLKVGKRLDVVNDSEVAIFSYRPDHGTDDEWKLISVKLELTTKMRYARVKVTGTDPQGYPIIAIRSDQPKTGSFYTKLGGLAETLEVTDSQIMTYADADKRAWAELDALKRDVWEGSILLAGHHFGLFDFDNSSSSFGSGKIIKLYYSPLGINGVLMKVNRMIIRSDGTTEIMINNVDTAIRNRLTRGLGTTEKIDSFLAPLGAVETVLCQFYVDSNIYTANDVYCKLYDNTNTVVTPQSFPLCEKISKSAYNAVCYQAAFEIGNAHSDNNIRYVELYHSGGTLIKYDLALTVNSIPKDLTFRKTRTNRLIVEVIGKAS